MVKLTASLVLARARAADIESVKKLNCWGNELTDVTIFREMPSVEVISLSVNSIATLEDFSYCPNVTELYVRKNNIQDLSEIHHLKKLTKLRVLWLADNPCATRDKYRMTVLKMLPNLQKLDNISVQPDEVNQAIEEGEDLPLPKQNTEELPNSHESPAATSSSSTTTAATASESLPQPDTAKRDHKAAGDSAIELSLEETNKIREKLGLKLLPVDKFSPVKTRHHTSKHRNANILSAVLSLVKELDYASLEEVVTTCKKRQEEF
ncbi:cilia- and flagella-associated protein 410-like [Ptychodera flava]|uniref:cilia- and flagella-associated protein 410-like n=1 Tax=Ptychodera flava TaxID=63121 RepID=UPI00396A1372